ncbi:hypothetical protein [Streptomyces chumphonensis]|uniref:hypothetical protein n=1 Tax=Streptomyces chumphonensis TaxID=1214925 RepID=UPI003D746100
MANASTTAPRTRLTSFRDAPAPSGGRPDRGAERSGSRRVARRVGALFLMVVSAFTLWFTMATPSMAITDDIEAACGPVNVPIPEARSSGLEAFFALDRADGFVKDAGTYIPSGDERYDGPDASYHRYGMAGLSWHVYGWDPGCFSVNRYVNFVPNMIFNASKTFATFTMALVGWSFGEDPFSFLNEPVGHVAGAVSDIAGAYLGLVGVLGAVYLGVKHWGPAGRVSAVLKGVGWMGLIAGLFFWFAANPTLLGTKINGLVGDITATGYQSLANIPVTGGADQTSVCNGSSLSPREEGGGTDAPQRDGPSADAAAACVQDALWVPLVYQPWLYGQVGNNGAAAEKWGPQMLNAQFIGTDEDGSLDEEGAVLMRRIAEWNGDGDEVGGESKSGSKPWDGGYVNDIPYLKLWANDLCHADEDENFRVCWGPDTGFFSSDERKVRAEDETTLKIAGGGDFSARLSAAAMSIMGGLVINSAVYFICAMLLAAKLGVFVLMIFAPFYLLMGIFPGPSRVAAIKLGELILANLFRQVGWSLGLVIITYMYTLILAPGGEQNWVLKVLTCALMTVMFGVYARPTLRALSGMAVGDKAAGGAIEGVASDFARKTAQGAATVGMAVATGGASAAMAVGGAASTAAASGQRLSAADGFKAAGLGLAQTFPDVGRRTRTAFAGRRTGVDSFNASEERRERRERTEALRNDPAAREGLAHRRRRRVHDDIDDAARDGVDERRARGDGAGADRLERHHFDRLRDPRTGWVHPDDPQHPDNVRSRNLGVVNPERGVRATAQGPELLAQHGLADNQAAAANLDRVLGMYDNAAHIDNTHHAGFALRALALQVASGDPNTAVARQEAARAVSVHGIPDRIDVVGLPSSEPSRVRIDVASELSRGSLTPDSTARDRMQYLMRVEQLAQQVPVGTTMSTALNDLRGVVANARAPQEQLTQALDAVRRAQNTGSPS